MKHNVINIAHVVLSMGTGGIERLLLSICEKNDKSELNYTVICLDFGGELLDRLLQLGVDCVVLSRKGSVDISLFWKLARIFSKKKIDVVHSHNQASCFYATFGALLSGRNSILVTEHSRHNIEGVFLRRLEKKILSCFQKQWVVVNKQLGLLANEKEWVTRKKIKVVENGIDFDDFSSKKHKDFCCKTRQLVGVSTTDKIIIMVARLSEVKNHGLMFRVLEDILVTYPSVSLVLVGDGELKKQLEKTCQSIDVSRKVLFLGVRKDIPALLAMSDVFVLCSHSEGLPLALLEACAAGIPVVITEPSNGACFIRDKVNGTVAKGGVADLSFAIKDMLSNEKRAKEMAHLSQKEVMRDYSLTSTIEKYKEIYRELTLTKRK